MSAAAAVIDEAEGETLVETVRSILTWRAESPAPGTPECTCSVQACAEPIPGSWPEPLRLTDEKTGLIATFCEACETRAFGSKYFDDRSVQ